MKQTDQIMAVLDELTLDEKLSCLANVFIRLGVRWLAVRNGQHIQIKNPQQLTELLLDERSKGESIGTALIQQGMVLDSWISSSKEKK